MTANIKITQILLKRGNTAATSAYTGPLGEIVIDTDEKSIRIQDGITAGGTLLSTSGGNEQLVADIAEANVQIYNLWANVADQAAAIGSLTSNAAAQAVVLNTLTSNAASQSTALDVLTANAASQAGTLIILTSNAAIQASALSVLTANAALQSSDLSGLTSNAATQALALNTLTANAASQATALNTLTANAASQADTLTTLTANAASQANSLTTLLSNAASQAQTLDVLSGNISSISADISDLWSNAATQNTDISNLRSNITAANSAIVTANSAVVSYVNSVNSAMIANVNAANSSITTANTGMKSYVDSALSVRTGNITFNGRTIGADTAAGDSGIVFDSAGNGEIHIKDYTGINNPNPDHWLHIGSSEPGSGENTGELAIDFNNSIDTLSGHITWTWDWWDSLGHGTHNNGTGVHSKFVLLKDHDHDYPLISFDYQSGNVAVGNINATKFTGNILSSIVNVSNDIRWANGVSVFTTITTEIDASNSNARSYTDTKVAALVNGAPAVLDTLFEIANSLGNSANLSTTLVSLIANAESNISGANSSISAIQSNLGGLSSNVNSLFSNAATQSTEINDLRANITAANSAISTANTAVVSYVNSLNSNMVANVNAANTAITTANTAMAQYVDDRIVALTGNITFDGNTISTTSGTDNGIVLNSAGNGEIYITDYTGIGNANPGYWLQIGDSLANIATPEGETHGTPIIGQLAIDYASGAPYYDGVPPFNDNRGFRGTVVFDWEYWTTASYGSQDLYDGQSFREFGLFRDGDHGHALFKVDLDTKLFTVDSLRAANLVASGTEISVVGDVSISGNLVVQGNVTAIPMAPYYADNTARDLAIPVPAVGMMVIVGSTFQGYNGSAWVSLS